MPKGNDSKGSKKRRKNYYVDFQKRPKINTLEPGLKGFLITCNNNEKRCIRECYNILNESAEKMAPSSQGLDGSTLAASQPKEAVEDVEDELEKELAALRGTNGAEGKRFQQLFTGVKSCLFIQTKLDPCKITLQILEDIHKQGKQRTVSTQKMYPVLGTCKAQLDSLRKTLAQVLEHLMTLPDPYQTDSKQIRYAVLFRSRHNSSLTKDDVVTTVVDMVRSQGICWEPEPRSPDCAISVDVLSGICCISVLPYYKKYKRYNLIEVAKGEETGTASKVENSTVSDKVKDSVDSEVKESPGKVENVDLDKESEENNKGEGSGEVSDGLETKFNGDTEKAIGCSDTSEKVDVVSKRTEKEI